MVTFPVVCFPQKTKNVKKTAKKKFVVSIYSAVRKHILGLLPGVLICGLKVIFLRMRSHKNNNKISREIGPDILPPKLMLRWFGRKTKPLFTVDFLCFSFANCSKNHLREQNLQHLFFFCEMKKEELRTMFTWPQP